MKQAAEDEKVMKKDLRLMKIGAIIVLFLAYVGYILLMILKKASGKHFDTGRATHFVVS